MGVNRSIASAEPETRTGVHRADEETIREDPRSVKELARTSDDSKVREAGENLSHTGDRRGENICPAIPEASAPQWVRLQEL